jgi:hypothetical protein
MIKDRFFAIRVDFSPSSLTIESMYKEHTFFEFFDTYRNRYGEYENCSLEELLQEIMEYAKKMSEKERKLIQDSFDLAKKAHA